MIVYHIIESLNDIDMNQEFYESNTLSIDGFIHCSLFDQVERVANSVFNEFDTLYVLEIDSNKLVHTSRLVLEDLYNLREDYPHVYGSINTSSILRILKMHKNNNTFVFKK